MYVECAAVLGTINLDFINVDFMVLLVGMLMGVFSWFPIFGGLFETDWKVSDEEGECFPKPMDEDDLILLKEWEVKEGTWCPSWVQIVGCMELPQFSWGKWLPRPSSWFGDYEAILAYQELQA